MAVLYAFCPCESVTAYNPEGGTLPDDLLEAFVAQHEGHVEARYCDTEGVLHYGHPEGPALPPR